MRILAAILIVVASLVGVTGLSRPALAQISPSVAVSRFFVTSDGARLHYADTAPGSRSGPVLVMVPGWTMPGWIFAPQVTAFAPRYRVVTLDPRGQGDSDAPASGYDQDRRGQDIAELLAQIGSRKIVLLGWSLGGLDSLAYIHNHGDAALSGLVLVDISVGENPAPTAPPPGPRPLRPAPRISREVYMAGFVRSMFRRPQPPTYLERLTEASLHTPEFAARELRAYPVPRSFWKEAVYSTPKPVLYIVRPGLAGQAGNLAVHHPAAETVVIPDLGHAMFVDDPPRFDAILQSFLVRRIGF